MTMQSATAKKVLWYWSQIFFETFAKPRFNSRKCVLGNAFRPSECVMFTH